MNKYQEVVKEVEECIKSTLVSNKIFNQANFEMILSKISYFPNNTHEINYGDELLKLSDENNLYLYSDKENNTLFFLNNSVYKLVENHNSLVIKSWKREMMYDDYDMDELDLLNEYNDNYDHSFDFFKDEDEDKRKELEDKLSKLKHEFEVKLQKLGDLLDTEDVTIYLDHYHVDINNIKLTNFGLFRKVGDIISTKEELLSDCKYFGTDTNFKIKVLENVEEAKDMIKISNDYNYVETTFYSIKLNIAFHLCAMSSLDTKCRDEFYFDNNILMAVSSYLWDNTSEERFYEFAEQMKREHSEEYTFYY